MVTRSKSSQSSRKKSVKSSFIEDEKEMKRSRLFEDIELCASGVPHRNKERLCQLVQRMGGRYSSDLSDTCTHLVCEGTHTEKYRAAIQLKNTQVVRAIWVLACWEKADRLPLSAKYRTPPFEGCVICVTGMSNIADRDEVKDLVIRNGGKFSANLDSGKVTHLLANRPEGEKYKAAVEWGNMYIVNFDWLTESLEKSARLPEEDYPVHLPGISKAQHNQDHRRQPDGHGNDKGDKKDFSVIPSTFPGAPTLKVDRTKAKESWALVNCQVFICGFDTEDYRQLCWLVDVAMGTRHRQLNPHITHAVIGNISLVDQRVMQALYTHPFNPVLVNSNWLLDSVQAQKMKDPSKYQIGNKAEQTNGSGEQSFKRRGAKKQGALFQVPSISASQKISQQKISSVNSLRAIEEENIPCTLGEEPATASSQNSCLTLSQNTGGFLSSCLFILGCTGLSESEEQKAARAIQKCGGALLQFSMDHRISVESLRDQMSVFPKKKQDICALLTAHGKGWQGTELKWDIDEDIRTFLEEEREAQPVTYLWLETCLKSKQVFEPKCVPRVFQPQKFQIQTFPYQIAGNMSFCVSTYSGAERFAMAQLARAMGVTMLPTLNRKVTHLILPKAEGEKYQKSLQWGIHAVSVHWLYHCAQYGYELGNEDEFKVGKQKPPTESNEEDSLTSEDTTENTEKRDDLLFQSLKKPPKRPDKVDADEAKEESKNIEQGPMEPHIEEKQTERVIIPRPRNDSPKKKGQAEARSPKGPKMGCSSTQNERAAGELDKVLQAMAAPPTAAVSGRGRGRKRLRGTVQVSDLNSRRLQDDNNNMVTSAYSATLRTTASLGSTVQKKAKWSRAQLDAISGDWSEKKDGKLNKIDEQDEDSLKSAISMTQESQIVIFADDDDLIMKKGF